MLIRLALVAQLPLLMVSLSLMSAPPLQGLSDRVVGHTALKLFGEVGLMS